MAKLDFETMQSLEELLDMKTGYVLDFSNDSFSKFVKGIINIDIYDGEGYEEYSSKANKLRQIFNTESNEKVSKLSISLLNYYEDQKLKEGKLSDYDKKKLSEIRGKIKELKQLDDGTITINEEIDEIMQKISTRNAEFSEMALDEKLKEVGNCIEYLLKEDGKFTKLDFDKISLGFFSEGDIKNLRKTTQCFRHSSQDSLKEREKYTINQKKLIIEIGVIMCHMIYNEIK